MQTQPKRILLKISGELLASHQTNFHLSSLKHVVASLQATYNEGIKEIGLVVGGGNLFRGRDAEKLNIPMYTADHVGMLATCMNALVLKELLNTAGLPCRIMADLFVHPQIDTFHIDRAQEALQNHQIVIFAHGLSQPYFTTDTASVVRAQEIHADLVVKATKVPGVFNKDPNLYPDAKRYTTLTFAQALQENIQVMDETAFCLLKKASLPLFVYRFGEPPSIREALQNETCGTWVLPEDYKTKT